MPVDIALVNGCSLRATLANIARARRLSIGFFEISDSSAASISRELTKDSVLLINIGASAEGLFRLFTELRLDRNFRGTAAVLSFLPLSHFSELEDWALRDSGGFFYFQLPFLTFELARLITSRTTLSDVSMERLGKNLKVERVVQQARLLKHDVGNKLGLALAHFRTLEKLSYFDDPKPDEIRKQLRHLHLCLTKDKIRDIRHNVEGLLGVASGYGIRGSRDVAGLDECWNSLAEWFRLMESLNTENELIPAEVFRSSKKAQVSIKEILGILVYLREAAQQPLNQNV